MFDYFQNNLDLRSDYKLYIYSHHEKSMLKKLYEKYGGDEETYNRIQNNMIDLLQVIKKTAILPIYSYSIKDVAKSMGFNWTAEDAGGAQSMIWYADWLKTKDEKHLKKILKYNKEDCEAMIVVKEWVEKE